MVYWAFIISFFIIVFHLFYAQFYFPTFFGLFSLDFYELQNTDYIYFLIKYISKLAYHLNGTENFEILLISNILVQLALFFIPPLCFNDSKNKKFWYLTIIVHQIIFFASWRIRTTSFNFHTNLSYLINVPVICLLYLPTKNILTILNDWLTNGFIFDRKKFIIQFIFSILITSFGFFISLRMIGPLVAIFIWFLLNINLNKKIIHKGLIFFLLILFPVIFMLVKMIPLYYAYINRVFINFGRFLFHYDIELKTYYIGKHVYYPFIDIGPVWLLVPFLYFLLLIFSSDFFIKVQLSFKRNIFLLFLGASIVLHFFWDIKFLQNMRFFLPFLYLFFLIFLLFIKNIRKGGIGYLIVNILGLFSLHTVLVMHNYLRNSVFTLLLLTLTAKFLVEVIKSLNILELKKLFREKSAYSFLFLFIGITSTVLPVYKVTYGILNGLRGHNVQKDLSLGNKNGWNTLHELLANNKSIHYYIPRDQRKCGWDYATPAFHSILNDSFPGRGHLIDEDDLKKDYVPIYTYNYELLKRKYPAYNQFSIYLSKKDIKEKYFSFCKKNKNINYCIYSLSNIEGQKHISSGEYVLFDNYDKLPSTNYNDDDIEIFAHYQGVVLNIFKEIRSDKLFSKLNSIFNGKRVSWVRKMNHLPIKLETRKKWMLGKLVDSRFWN